ncbi:MAG: glycosyltransferase family 1 protein [Bacteroidetes bacterium]|nr:glycosyltransferase family 1 protein [Bacteroidota bacterium]
MKIAVNTRFLIHDKLEGIGRFSYETLKCMVLKHPEHEFIFFFDRPFSQEYLFSKNVTGIILYPPARHPLLFIWYFEWSIFRALRKFKPDVFLSCDGFLCLRSKVPQLAVIHDLAFEHNPEDVSFFARTYYKYFFPRFARKASHICTVSDFSKQDIIEKYHIDNTKISVIYNGASAIFKPINELEKQAIKSQFSDGENYFVYVGALQPRKNISRLLQAFEKFKIAHDTPCKLLIVGRKAWKTQSIEDTYERMKFKCDVLFTGRVSDEDLSKIIAGATALTYIPYLEGFGIPILEAMQCGTPVITSNRSALPEVAGDAAILINPFDSNEICAAMVALYFDKNQQITLSNNGLIQSGKFSWEKTADLLWNCLEPY